MKIYTRKYQIIKTGIITIGTLIFPLIIPFSWICILLIYIGLDSKNLIPFLVGIISLFFIYLFSLFFPWDDKSCFFIYLFNNWEKCSKKYYTKKIIKIKRKMSTMWNDL